jgi:hypothetical protein
MENLLGGYVAEAPRSGARDIMVHIWLLERRVLYGISRRVWM